MTVDEHTDTNDTEYKHPDAEPEREDKVFGREAAKELVAENQRYTPRVALIDTQSPEEIGDDEGPVKINEVERHVVGDPDVEPGRHGTASGRVLSRFTGVMTIEMLTVEVIYVEDGDFDYNDRMAKAIDWAVENGADIISMSLYWYGNDRLRESVTNARDAGVLLFACAGNEDGPQTEVRSAPAKYEDAVSVGATDTHGGRASFSNYTAGDDDDWVSAWGRKVKTIWPDEVDGEDDTPFWWEPGAHSGTSTATPIAAAVAALVLAVNPILTPDEILQILRETGTELDTDHPIGPRVHSERAVSRALEVY